MLCLSNDKTYNLSLESELLPPSVKSSMLDLDLIHQWFLVKQRLFDTIRTLKGNFSILVWCFYFVSK